MAEIIAEWAGKERLFRLSFGGVLDLEQACGKVAVGEIFQRISAGRFFAGDVWHVIRLSLIGGGESPLEVKRLLDAHFDHTPYMVSAGIAGEILIGLMVGVESAGKGGGDAPAPMKFSELSQVCRVFNLSPNDLRAMEYADLINMISGFNAASSGKLEHLSEEEFAEILAKYEPGALNDGK